MNGQFDFLVIGDDEASLAAAAAAAKARARVAMLVPAEKKKRSSGASPAIANFVWRRLELQDYDLTLEPVSSLITLLKEGAPITTHAKARDTADALSEQGSPDHLLWQDFLEEMAALASEPVYAPAGFNDPGTPDVRKFAALLANPVEIERLARLFGSCADMLRDFFSDKNLQTHLAAHALGAGGWGDHEAGSAQALAECVGADAWRVRTPKDGVSLRSVLEQVCQEAGVETTVKKLLHATAVGKHAQVSFEGEDKIKVKHVFFATPGAARQWGVHDCRGALGHGAHADFTVRFKLNEGAEPPTGDAEAIFQIVDDGGDIQAARDHALQGRLYDQMPVEFEFVGNGEVIARSSYLPAAFYEDGEWRGWTGQDRQAVASIIKERLSSRMPGFATLIRRTETELSAPPVSASPFADCNRVIVQPHRHDAISAAVKLIDKVMAADE